MTGTAWLLMLLWITEDLTCLPCLRERMRKDGLWEMILPPMCWCAGAINIGIDRQEMIDNVLNGYGTPAYSICDQLPWYNDASEVEYDPEGGGCPAG